MNGRNREGPKTGEPVTPIRPEVARSLLKNQIKMQFAGHKPDERALMVEAMNEVLIDEARTNMAAKTALEGQIEESPQYEEPEQTLGSKFKDMVGDNVSGFSGGPIRHLIAKAMKCMLPLLGVSAVINGIEMWSDPAKQTTGNLIKGPFTTAWEAITIASGFVYDNLTMFSYGAAAALALTILNRPTVSKKFGRAFYAGLLASVPTIFNDLVTNMQNGASTIGEKIDLSLMGNISIVALSAALILSWITPKFPKHDEDKETSPKEPSKIALALGAITGGLSWAIFNAIGAVARAPGKLISAVRDKLDSRKESVEPAPTEEMPAEMAPTPVTEEMGATAEESLPETEEIEAPEETAEEPEEAAEEPTTEDWHPANQDLADVMEEETEEPTSGDILIPLDE